MIGSLITRGFILVLGYIYPAYECFKSVEKHRPNIEQLRFWCQYWITIAVVTVLERLGDAFISWLPMYSEAKLAFIIYLWHPKTKGTTYIYLTFLQPFVARHEVEIDRNLNELRTRAGDMFLLYWHSTLSCVQARVFQLLQYIVSQSQSSSHQGDLNVPHFPQPASVSCYQPAPPPPGHQSPPPPPSQGFQPTAPPLPPGYDTQLSSTPGSLLPLSDTGTHEQAILKEEEMEFELVEKVEPPVPPSVSEQINQPLGVYMTRRRKIASQKRQQ